MPIALSIHVQLTQNKHNCADNLKNLSLKLSFFHQFEPNLQVWWHQSHGLCEILKGISSGHGSMLGL